ncbi:MAG: nucleotidyltransferase domain-containing protein [Ruminococcus sp.]|jgi:predicted nucleotidyltransferase
MVDIDTWLTEYKNAVEKQFGSRIWFMGLQGSYGRKEAGEQSDIDVVLILDDVSADDLQSYSRLLDHLPQREKICGFVSGKKELMSWEPSDLFQFYYDTVPVSGSLDALLHHIRKQDVLRAIHMGVCNVYHMCVHNLIHEKSGIILKELYKSAAFTLQAIDYYRTGGYRKQRADLCKHLPPGEREILETGVMLKETGEISEKELAKYSSRLTEWASKWMQYCSKEREENKNGSF